MREETIQHKKVQDQQHKESNNEYAITFDLQTALI